MLLLEDERLQDELKWIEPLTGMKIDGAEEKTQTGTLEQRSCDWQKGRLYPGRSETDSRPSCRSRRAWGRAASRWFNPSGYRGRAGKSSTAGEMRPVEGNSKGA